MEKVIVCPICNDENHCFEEMQEDYSSFMCFHCGFMSDTRFTEENESLKKQIAILENPYMQWYLGDIEDELFDVKLDCVDRFVESVKDDDLRDKYVLLTEAQVLKQGEDNE